MKTSIMKRGNCDMKQIGIMNKGKLSGRNSRFLAIPQLLRRVVAICLLVLASTGVSAGDYVIFNGTVYLDGSSNVTGTGNLPGTTTFNPRTCIWTGTSGNYFYTEAGFHLYTQGSDICTLNGDYSSYIDRCTLGGSAESGTNGKTIYIYSSSYYVYYTGSYWNVTNKSSNASKCVFQVTTTPHNESSVNPIISGDKTFTTKGESYTFFVGTPASYIPGYIDYIFYNNTHHYFKTDNETALTAAPTESEEFDYTWSLSPNANGYVSVNSSTGVVTYNKIYHTDTEVTLTLTATSRESGKVLTATKQITFKASTVSPTAVSVTSTTPMTVYVGQTGNISYSLTPATCYDNVLFETGDASIATVNANGIVSGVSAGSTTITVKAMKYNSTEYVSATVTVNVLNKVATPTISFTDEGEFTISCATSGATIHYTTNGDEPTISDATIGNGVQSSTTVAVETVVKAIAVLVGYVQSDVASNQFLKSGISGNKVILNDYEDHNWTYYQSQDNLPNGYPVTHLSSPNPRNVKITYKGNGQLANGTAVTSVRVGIDDRNTETFIYYKTIENNDGYKYTTIPNPFSIRPKVDNIYYGFSHWKITSVVGGTISGKSVGSTVNAETEITFVPSGTYTPNCTSMEVVFEAVWDVAEVKTGNTSFTNNYGVERMFYVIRSDDNSNITSNSKACTYTSIYPNGTTNGSTPAQMSDRKYRRGGFTCSADSKFEYIYLDNNYSTLNASGKNLTIGRGVANHNGGSYVCAGNVVGVSSAPNNALNYTIRLESGVYSQFDLLINSDNATTFSSTVTARAVFGCDYDRASGNNNNLSVAPSGTVYGSNGQVYFSSSSNKNNLTYDFLIKSGKVQGSKNISDASADVAIYMGNTGNGNDNDGVKYMGKRRLVMEGGEIASIAGGLNAYGSDIATYTVNDGAAVEIRIKGGTVRGSIYGAAAFAGASGDRLFVFTGGTINGWVAGGANGTQSNGGVLYGTSHLYIGGNTLVNSNGSLTPINSSLGGFVFGAGCGFSTTSTSGQVSSGTHVVMADNAYVERGVYGGGSFGYCDENNTSEIYIMGGYVEGKSGGVTVQTQSDRQGNVTATYSHNPNISGGVFGGACQNKGGSSVIYMSDGQVEGGLYGGSNSSGTLSGNVTMQINGGQVGTSTTPANVHGGGFGASTIVSGNVDVTLGTKSGEDDVTYTTSGDAVIYGDVYGGSALGQVNATPTTDRNGNITGYTYTNNTETNVTLNAGTIYGSLYGGGLGNNTTAANVYGNVQVTVYGGSVKKTNVDGSGGVYGCNNINGAPQRNVTVDIYGTDPAPAEGQYALFSVYGGGNKADYTYGNGYPKVTVHNCDNSIEYVYGGGNAAAVAATDVTIYGGNTIGNVFGGGNGLVTAANVTGNTNVKIYGGTIGNVFGGSNSQGNIGGTINLTIEGKAEAAGGEACPMFLTNVYGGGNKASSNPGSITVNCFTGRIENIYGGANDADINGNITLTIQGGNFGRIFGGNNTGHTVKGDVTVNVTKALTCDLNVDYVYGGGNAAAVGENGDTRQVSVTVGGGAHVNNMVFGGGLGETAVLNGNTHVQIKGTGTRVDGNVYGGGNGAKVTGNTDVIIGE